ncbi:MAG: efflux RND transporter periplasmic adaptor subunit [Pseudomonadota bacterium]
MKRTPMMNFALVGVAVVASAGGGYWLAHQQRQSADHATSAEATSERKVLYWYDPMVPDKHFDKPGKSPFMDMELVPKYADAAAEAGGVSINPMLTQNLGVRLAVVERVQLDNALSVPATVMFNERDVAIVQTRAAGFVERVHAHAPGDVIKQGAALVEITVPEWASAQAEWLALRNAGDQELARAARERLKLLGMPENAIRQLERSGRTQQQFTIAAPIAGVIQALDVRQGMTISPGMTVARINGLRTVWLEAAVPEAQGGQMREGQRVSARLAAYPDQELAGKITAVLPDLNTQSRTLRVRMEFPNPEQKLRPGMFAQVLLGNEEQKAVLAVPSEALIRTGKRSVVLLANADGSFAPVEVTSGQEGKGRTEILGGLSEGQKVVASGQFLIDSEASLSGVLARMNEAPASAPEAQAKADAIEALGVVEKVSSQEIMLSHEPIPALDWPAMTMPFTVVKEVDLSKLKTGQRIRFWLQKQGDDLVIVKVAPAGGQP